MSTAPDLVPSIVKTVVVPIDQARAFELFTAGIGTWWPLATHSVGGETSRGVAVTSTAIVETFEDGTTTSWGEVVAWQPPSRFVVTWHPGSDAGPEQTQVAVSFEPASGGTLVRLEHSGWERIAPARRDNYDSGWDVVLGAFVSAA
jgi:uncharacterized protein YndB with AHSA1/START domain